MAPVQRDPTKKTLSVRIDAALVERARAVARDLAGRPTYLTLARLVEEAVAERVRHYERIAEGEPEPSPSRNRSPTLRR